MVWGDAMRVGGCNVGWEYHGMNASNRKGRLDRIGIGTKEVRLE